MQNSKCRASWLGASGIFLRSQAKKAKRRGGAGGGHVHVHVHVHAKLTFVRIHWLKQKSFNSDNMVEGYPLL